MLDLVSTSIHMAKAAPIRVDYLRPEDGNEALIHFNLGNPDNLLRFLRLITWASQNKVTLTIRTAH